MTIGLTRWLRLAASLIGPAQPSPRRHITRLEDLALSDRDLADLNLPEDVASRLRGVQAACEARRRVYL